MDYKNILLSFEGEIGILALNRPKALNALNMETLRDIQAGIQEVVRWMPVFTGMTMRTPKRP